MILDSNHLCCYSDGQIIFTLSKMICILIFIYKMKLMRFNSLCLKYPYKIDIDQWSESVTS